MIRLLLRATAAELVKLRSLPAVNLAAAGMIGAAVVLAAALTTSNDGDPGAASIVARSVPFLQVGPILLGVLASAAEYTGSHIHTTLAAVPRRLIALSSKMVAYLAVAVVTSGAAVAAGLATWLGVTPSQPAPASSLPSLWPVAGATLYLALIGLLAHVLAVLLRSLLPPLVAMLGLVFIISPLLGTVSRHARWLPDQAGALLHRPDADAVLSPLTGALALLAWIATIGAVAAGRFVGRDA